ncbi:uncharacterized protein LOC122382415 [Amphibalanus amphitrite]|uniref:uncharacterized protein LOC122382415 n=1 Tax=Amphibalanus amphitrite TaxID=1232801 RepID=UPI001C91FCA0|nr:uncharacterized protein LOC122382415 [Amphibalanus amphitrite]
MTRNKSDDWDVDIKSAHIPAVHEPPRFEMARTPEHRLNSGSFQRSATMTIALDGEQAHLSGGGWGRGGDTGDGRHVPLIVCGVTAGLLLVLSAALTLLLWRRRAMKSRSEKIYKLRKEEKDPWSESPPGKSSGCLKLCTEGIRGSGLPIYYHRASQPASPAQTPTTTAADVTSTPLQHKPPTAPPLTVKSHNIPPPLEPSGGRPKDSPRWTDNVVYISGYSPTLEKRRPLGEPATSATASAQAEVHDTTAAYRTLPSKQKRLQQFYAAASAADVGPCAPSAGEVSPDRVDLMLLDEEMRTRSLPSWMRNKNKGKLQDSSQHPLSFSHKQRNRMGNDAASVIARARTHYPSRSGQEPTIVYDVRTAL